MTQEEHDRWEQWYREAVERDIAREIYKRCDAEDAKRERGEG